MGTWGTSIFSDDLASDIRSEFRDKIGSGKNPIEATRELINEYKDTLNDSEESSIFWIALSATQLKLGRLQENVKQKALEVIDSEVDLQRWVDDKKSLKRRQLVLEQLKQQLKTEQPTAKKITFQFIRTTAFEVGDLVAVKLTNDKVSILRVVGINQDHCGDRYPRFEILNYLDSKTPTINEIKKMDILKEREDVFPKPSNTILIALYGKRDLEPWDKITLIAKNVDIKKDYVGSTPLIWWKNFEEYIIERFKNNPVN